MIGDSKSPCQSFLLGQIILPLGYPNEFYFLSLKICLKLMLGPSWYAAMCRIRWWSRPLTINKSPSTVMARLLELRGPAQLWPWIISRSVSFHCSSLDVFWLTPTTPWGQSVDIPGHITVQIFDWMHGTAGRTLLVVLINNTIISQKKILIATAYSSDFRRIPYSPQSYN